MECGSDTVQGNPVRYPAVGGGHPFIILSLYTEDILEATLI